MRGVLITSSILIVLIAALRPLLRGKIDPRAQYALWLIVAVRLLLPVNLFTSAYSALALLDRAQEPPQLVQEIGQTVVPVRSYDNARAQVVEEYRRRGIEEAALTPGDLRDIDTQARERMNGPTLAELAAKLAKPVRLGGAAVMAAWFIFVNLALRRKLKAARRLKGVDCPLPVYVSDALPSPCLCGVLRPRIYVTPAAVESPDRLRHVLAHELTHYRQKDHWWALLRCACLCLYWFDPLVWWAAALSRQDCELACDEGAIRGLGEGERISYGRTLVAMIAAGRTSLLQTATTMTGGKRKVRERIKLIARRPKTVIAVALVLALIVGGAVGCTFTGAPEEAKTLDNLKQRLEDIPEELRDRVRFDLTNEKPGHLADYWFDIPAEWTEDFQPWLLGVLTQSHEEVLQSLSISTSPSWECFARSGDTYFAINWDDSTPPPSDGAEAFYAAFEAIRAYAMEQVLDTEGVEPYSPSTGTQPLDTLRARLEDIPAELRDDVVLHEGEPLWDSALAGYFLDNTGGEGWLHTVCQWDQLGFEEWLYSTETGTYDVFARDAEHCYAIMRPTSIQVEQEDWARFSAAQEAIGKYAREQVLSTQGVEPYDPAELRERDHLWEGKTYTDIAYWPYKNITGDTENSVWIIRLVQLAKDGPGGVWVPEREQIIDANVDATPRRVRPSETREMGLTVTQYAQYLQDEADAGRADWATDPIQACIHYALTVCGHSEANVTEDCFTWDSAYIEQVLAGLLPTEEEKAIQAVMDEIWFSPSIDFALAPAGSSRVYAYPTDLRRQDDTPLYGWWSTVRSLPAQFGWEYLGEAVGDLPQEPQGDTLRIETPERTFVQVWSGSNVILIQRTFGDVAETAYYEARSLGGDPNSAPLGTPVLNPGPYQILRGWFDEVELYTLRATSVPDRGQSHENVVLEWVEGYEGAMTKCAPGSRYACTDVRVRDVRADAHAHLTPEELEEFARYNGNGLAAEDYGKTWFSFSYSLVFVPEDHSTDGYFWAGNTWYYEEDDAPEEALTWSRVGYMRLTDEGWFCEGCGTGW